MSLYTFVPDQSEPFWKTTTCTGLSTDPGSTQNDSFASYKKHLPQVWLSVYLLFIDKLVVGAEVVSVGRTFGFTAQRGEVKTL